MKTRLHLISMPWALYDRPSLQTGCLKAFVDQEFGDRLETRTYSAGFKIPIDTFGGNLPTIEMYCASGESSYFLLCYRAFPNLWPERPLSFDQALRQYNRTTEWGRFKKAELLRLDRSTRDYIQKIVVPHLTADGLNLVGFTMSYDQTYASIYCMEYLKRHVRGRRIMFLAGGNGAMLPVFAATMRRLGQNTLNVVGEGEIKLQKIVEVALQHEQPDDLRALDEKLRAIPGVIHVSQLRETAADPHSQLANMDALPLPDFDEYFETARSSVNSEDTWNFLRERLVLPVEGSRGCFARCDFCGFSVGWQGYRKSRPRVVLDRVRRLLRCYQAGRIAFVDNVCDLWAEEYADLLIEARSSVPAYMDLRAHHPESFFTKLALAGVDHTQVGVEAVSPSLLKHIGKGARVIQNLATQKWQAELGIHSGSNLITYHPRSEVQDVRETRRVVEQIPHIVLFRISRFAFAIGSPLYDALDERTRRGMTPQLWAHIHPTLDEYMVSWGLLPRGGRWLPTEVRRAWDQFSRWYREFRDEQAIAKPSCRLMRLEDTLIIRDTRFGRTREHVLKGSEAVIYDACHRGAKRESIVQETGCPAAEVSDVLTRLEASRLLLRTEDYYLSLALRSKDELIMNLLRGPRGENPES